MIAIKSWNAPACYDSVNCSYDKVLSRYSVNKQDFIFLRIVLRSTQAKFFINISLSSSCKTHLCCRMGWHLGRHRALLSRLLQYKVPKYRPRVDMPRYWCLLNIQCLPEAAFLGSKKSSELYRVRVQCLNKKKRSGCDSAGLVQNWKFSSFSLGFTFVFSSLVIGYFSTLSGFKVFQKSLFN